MIIIAGNECENCIHCSIDEKSKARVFVECAARDKVYYWGQAINCEDKKKREVNKDESN